MNFLPFINLLVKALDLLDSDSLQYAIESRTIRNNKKFEENEKIRLENNKQRLEKEKTQTIKAVEKGNFRREQIKKKFTKKTKKNDPRTI